MLFDLKPHMKYLKKAKRVQASTLRIKKVQVETDNVLY